MQKIVTIFLLVLSTLAIFKSATPFLSYKANYEFIFKEICINRGTEKHGECDGFCYLKKKVEQQHGGDHENPHSKKALTSNLYSSIFGILQHGISIESPLQTTERPEKKTYNFPTQIFLDVLSPPPKS